jgi:hypothetical protein
MDFQQAAHWAQNETQRGQTQSGLFSIAAGLVALGAAIVEASKNLSEKQKKERYPSTPPE